MVLFLSYWIVIQCSVLRTPVNMRGCLGSIYTSSRPGGRTHCSCYVFGALKAVCRRLFLRHCQQSDRSTRPSDSAGFCCLHRLPSKFMSSRMFGISRTSLEDQTRTVMMRTLPGSQKNRESKTSRSMTSTWILSKSLIYFFLNFPQTV
jgi:hypothetical protein